MYVCVHIHRLVVVCERLCHTLCELSATYHNCRRPLAIWSAWCWDVAALSKSLKHFDPVVVVANALRL